MKEGENMQLSRQLGIFITVAILLSSCAPVDLMVGSDESVIQPAGPNSNVSAQVPVNQDDSGNGEVNECLNCHSNKDRLIESADPVVEEAESESSGVG